MNAGIGGLKPRFDRPESQFQSLWFSRPSQLFLRTCVYFDFYHCDYLSHNGLHCSVPASPVGLVDSSSRMPAVVAPQTVFAAPGFDQVVHPYGGTIHTHLPDHFTLAFLMRTWCPVLRNPNP